MDHCNGGCVSRTSGLGSTRAARVRDAALAIANLFYSVTAVYDRRNSFAINTARLQFGA